MKKKVLLLFASLALVTTLAVNGTFATELGNIFNTLTNMLEQFGITPMEDNSALEVKVVSSVVDKNGNDAIMAPAHYGETIDWNSTPGVVTYRTYVNNAKTESAYVRICMYVRKHDRVAHADPVYDNEKFEFKAKTTNANYNLYIFDYKDTLTGNEMSTIPITMKVALTKDTTNADMNELGQNFIQVHAFAIQAGAFANLDANGKKITDTNQAVATPAEALTLALGSINAFNPFPNLYN